MTMPASSVAAWPRASASHGRPVVPGASRPAGAGGTVECPLSGRLGTGSSSSAAGMGGANQVSQQKLNAQLTRVWWRRMAVSERTWKSAQPSSSLTCV